MNLCFIREINSLTLQKSMFSVFNTCKHQCWISVILEQVFVVNLLFYTLLIVYNPCRIILSIILLVGEQYNVNTQIEYTFTFLLHRSMG